MTLFPGPVDTGLVRDGRATSDAQRETEIAFLARRAVPAARVDPSLAALRALVHRLGRAPYAVLTNYGA